MDHWSVGLSWESSKLTRYSDWGAWLSAPASKVKLGVAEVSKVTKEPGKCAGWAHEQRSEE